MLSRKKKLRGEPPNPVGRNKNIVNRDQPSYFIQLIEESLEEFGEKDFNKSRADKLLKDNDYEKGIIIVDDKITQTTREYNKNQIFKFGDDLTDSMIKYLEKLREGYKKAS